MLFSNTRKLWRLQTLVNYVANRYFKVTFSQGTRLLQTEMLWKHWSKLHDHIIVAECIGLNSIANVVFFDNIIFQSSATRSAMRQTIGFYCENKWRYEPDSCRIYDPLLFCPWKQHVFMTKTCSLGCFPSVTTLSVCTVGNGWEGAGTTEEDHDSPCSLQGFEPEISRIPNWVFYHYKIRIFVTFCYTWNTNGVQSVTSVKHKLGNKKPVCWTDLWRGTERLPLA